MVEPMQAAQHYVPPSPRQKRSQAVYRLQVGMFGLCAMLLIVGLANIIRDRMAKAETVDPIQEIVAADAKPKKPVSDPLADIGVVPAADPGPSPKPTPITSPIPTISPIPTLSPPPPGEAGDEQRRP